MYTQHTFTFAFTEKEMLSVCVCLFQGIYQPYFSHLSNLANHLKESTRQNPAHDMDASKCSFVSPEMVQVFERIKKKRNDKMKRISRLSLADIFGNSSSVDDDCDENGGPNHLQDLNQQQQQQHQLACKSCSEPFSSKDTSVLFVEADNSHYHTQCFKCFEVKY